MSPKRNQDFVQPAAGSVTTTVAPPIDVIRAIGWDVPPWLIYGFSTRIGGRTRIYHPLQEAGELDLGFNALEPEENILANRQIFLDAVTASHPPSGHKLVTLRQIHSTLVRRVGRAQAQDRAVFAGDGLMTDEVGVLLGIVTADCIPILIADIRNRAVAAFHAGWRGTLGRIVEKGVGRMRLEFGSRPEDLRAAIGPGIGPCCYRVGEEVVQQFQSQFSYASDLFRDTHDPDPVREKYPMLFLSARAPGHTQMAPSPHLDLVAANHRQLLDAGLVQEAIHAVAECTSCHPERYFSHRAEHGFTGRMLSVIGIQGEVRVDASTGPTSLNSKGAA